MYFAYPASWSGDLSWVAVDGYSAATILGLSAESGYQFLPESYSWSNAFLGFIPGQLAKLLLLHINWISNTPFH